MASILMGFGIHGAIYLLFKCNKNYEGLKYDVLIPIALSLFLWLVSPFFLVNQVVDIKSVKVELEKVNGQYYTEDNSSGIIYYYKNGKKQEVFSKINRVKYSGDEAYLTYYEYDTDKLSLADKMMWFPTSYFADGMRCGKDAFVTLPVSERED